MKPGRDWTCQETMLVHIDVECGLTSSKPEDQTPLTWA
jgi:hypothetical protein